MIKPEEGFAAFRRKIERMQVRLIAIRMTMKVHLCLLIRGDFVVEGFENNSAIVDSNPTSFRTSVPHNPRDQMDMLGLSVIEHGVERVPPGSLAQASRTLNLLLRCPCAFS